MTVRRRMRWRPFMKLWHRWFGLGAALWLFLLAITGCAITFYDELDTWLNPDLRTAPTVAAGPASATPVANAVAGAQAILPGFMPNMINLATEANESVWMLGRAPVGGGQKAVQVFADPRTGAVLGWRESGKLALDRRHLMDVFYGLHIDLLLGPTMTWFLGLVSLLWVFDHVFAMVLAIPRLVLWREAFRIKGRTGSLRWLFDVHRAPGAWLLPVTAVLAVTGVTLAWPESSRHGVSLLSPVSERLDEHFPEVPPVQNPIGIDRAIALAAPIGVVDSVRPMPAKGVIAVRTFDPRDLDDQGRLWTYVAMADGRFVGQRHDNGTSAGDQFFAWQYPLHSGKVFGLTGRILVFLGGLVTMVLCVSGVLLWRRRARAP